MRFLIVAIFGAACVTSGLWYEARKHELARVQATTFGLTAIVAWVLVLVLGTIF
jgi:hypothetical protein